MYNSDRPSSLKPSLSYVRQRALNYVSDRSGNVGMMLALALVPLLIAVGAAIDYTKMASQVQTAQDTVDAAVLFAASEYYQTYSRESAGSVGNFAANFHLESNSPDGQFVVETVVDNVDQKSLKLKSTISGRSQHTFMRIFGNPETSWTTEAYSEVSVPKIEIIMVIDASASMEGEKLAQLKLSMNRFFENVAPYRRGDSHVAITLLPYSENVNFGTASQDWLHPSDRNGFNGCFNVLDSDRPRSLSASTLSGGGGRFNAPFCPPRESSAVLFATDREPLQEQVRNLDIGFGTHTEKALQWGERFLDNDWRNSARQIAEDAPVRVTDDTHKVVILLTDGAIAVFDRDQDGRVDPKATRTADERISNTEFTDRCRSLDQQPNLDLYAVAYSIRNSEFEGLLKNCVSGGGEYFDAEIEDLDAVFKRIASSLTPVRLAG